VKGEVHKSTSESVFVLGTWRYVASKSAEKNAIQGKEALDISHDSTDLIERS
jgi:hypothetical protein